MQENLEALEEKLSSQLAESYRVLKNTVNEKAKTESAYKNLKMKFSCIGDMAKEKEPAEFKNHVDMVMSMIADSWFETDKQEIKAKIISKMINDINAFVEKFTTLKAESKRPEVILERAEQQRQRLIEMSDAFLVDTLEKEQLEEEKKLPEDFKLTLPKKSAPSTPMGTSDEPPIIEDKNIISTRLSRVKPTPSFFQFSLVHIEMSDNYSLSFQKKR